MVSGKRPRNTVFEANELYGQLRAMAGRLLRSERVGHTLQPTALVHEAYLRLQPSIGDGDPDDDLLTRAAGTMRRVLVDHARRRNAARRAGSGRRIPLDVALALYEQRSFDLVALDDALERLAAMDQRLARIVDLRFFGGFTAGETAELLGVCERTVVRGWRFARVWLFRELGADARDVS